jgi:hypothetical protein
VAGKHKQQNHLEGVFIWSKPKVDQALYTEQFTLWPKTVWRPSPASRSFTRVSGVQQLSRLSNRAKSNPLPIDKLIRASQVPGATVPLSGGSTRCGRKEKPEFLGRYRFGSRRTWPLSEVSTACPGPSFKRHHASASRLACAAGESTRPMVPSFSSLGDQVQDNER